MRADAWFADASPKVQHTMESSGRSWGTCPRRRARPSANAIPTAFGRWEAMVLVCGGTHSRRLPQTLWRPWLMGSSARAQMESSVSSAGSTSGAFLERAIMSPPER